MSLPHKGVYLPQQAQILYGDAGLVGDLPLGTFNPVNSSGYGLLGGLKNATINMKVESSLSASIAKAQLNSSAASHRSPSM
jgi:hypothetical protein